MKCSNLYPRFCKWILRTLVFPFVLSEDRIEKFFFNILLTNLIVEFASKYCKLLYVHGIDHHKTCDLFAPQSIQSTEDIFDHSQSIINLGTDKGVG